jgi:N6-adenosine-specific RNA methylase IME4
LLDATAAPVHPLLSGSVGKYRTILADPPWRYKSKGSPCWKHKQPQTCLVEYYYQTMTLSEIKGLPVQSLSAQDSVLFLWATVPLIEEAFDVMRAWGWKYKTMLTWHKTNRDCMGYWFRVCTEHLLVGVRGNVRAFRSMRRTIFETPRGRHSQKPEESFALIESVSPGPYLEMFARRRRPGWDVWGNEVESDVDIRVRAAAVSVVRPG